MPPKKTKKAKKETESKAAKKRCLKCGESFRTKILRVNHELVCNKLNTEGFEKDTEALEKAWKGLTPEQQAQYGSPEKLHEACLKIIEELRFTQ